MRQRVNIAGKYLLVSLFFCTVNTNGAELESDLMLAAKGGNFANLEVLLVNKSAVNTVQPDGTSALAWAVYYDNRQAVEKLIKVGADVNASNDNGVNPLHLACYNQNAGIVGLLLEAGAKPDMAQVTGETALMTCSNTGVTAAVKDLIEHGAAVNAKESGEDQTALMWAATEKHPDVVQLLIKAGADVNARSRIFKEPEPFVVEVPNIFGRSYPATVRFVESTGGFTALQFAAQQGDIESARHLLEGGADINYSTVEEGSALVIAAAAGHEDLAHFLLEKGADPNITDAFGLGAIHYAVHEGIIIMNGAMPFATDDLGWQRKNLPRLLSSLLDYGADVNATVKHAWPYLDNPFLRSIEEAAQIDIVGATPLHLAAASGDSECIKLLVEKGLADKQAVTDGGATVFMLAAGAGVEKGMRDEAKAIEAASLVLSLGEYDVNARLTDNNAANGPGAGKNDGRTVLHFVAGLGWKDMTLYLAQNGADLDVEDRYGQTALKLAMGDPESLYFRQVPVGRYDDRFRQTNSVKYPEVIKALLDSGAKPFTGKIVKKESID